MDTPLKHFSQSTDQKKKCNVDMHHFCVTISQMLSQIFLFWYLRTYNELLEVMFGRDFFFKSNNESGLFLCIAKFFISGKRLVGQASE